MHKPPLDILIVEDCEDSAALVADLLACMGHRVRVVHLGRPALDLIDVARPDTVVVDLELPDMDGCDLALAIRTRFGSAIRLVAATGHAGSEAQERARAVGFDAYIKKPFRMDELQVQLQDTLPKVAA
jgi:CheY-like chemotaxis protein